MARSGLRFVETGGGPFILLAAADKKHWRGVERFDGARAGDVTDYDRACALLTRVGVISVGRGQALVLGEAEVTAFLALDDGGVFVQRVFGDDDRALRAAVMRAAAAGKWKKSRAALRVRDGRLALFDSACCWSDVDAEERLAVKLAPGTYEISTTRLADGAMECGLVRLRVAPTPRALRRRIS